MVNAFVNLLAKCPFCGGTATISKVDYNFLIIKCLNRECRAEWWYNGLKRLIVVNGSHRCPHIVYNDRETEPIKARFVKRFVVLNTNEYGYVITMKHWEFGQYQRVYVILKDRYGQSFRVYPMHRAGNRKVTSIIKELIGDNIIKMVNTREEMEQFRRLYNDIGNIADAINDITTEPKTVAEKCREVVDLNNNPVYELVE